MRRSNRKPKSTAKLPEPLIRHTRAIEIAKPAQSPMRPAVVTANESTSAPIAVTVTTATSAPKNPATKHTAASGIPQRGGSMCSMGSAVKPPTLLNRSAGD